MAAQHEEVVPDADAGRTEHVLPETLQTELDLIARLDELFGCALRMLRHRQCLAIDLAVRRLRKALEPHERRRDHVQRQSPGKTLRHLGDQRRIREMLGTCDEIGDETIVRRSERNRSHHGIENARVHAHRLFDLRRFDAKAAQFDLMIEASQVLERQIAAPYASVARAVHAGVRITRERIGQKLFGRERRNAEVAGRHTGAADVDLTGHALRNGLAMFVQNIDGGCIDRPSDRNRRSFFARDPMQCRPDRRLGRTIHVPERCAPVEQPRCKLARKGLASAKDLQVTMPGPAGIEQHLPRGWCGLHERRRVGLHQCHQLSPVRHEIFCRHEYRSTADERQEELEACDIERHGRHRQQAFARPQARRVTHRSQEVCQRTARHFDALRPSGRSGRIDDVRRLTR